MIYFGIKFEFNIYVGEDFVMMGYYFFFQFESWNIEGQQIIDFWMVIKDYCFYVVVGQYVGVCQFCWICVDYCYLFVCLVYVGYIWVLVYFKCFIVDIVFNVIDGYCVEFIVQCIGVFVQVVLWVDVVIYFWQGVGLV